MDLEDVDLCVVNIHKYNKNVFPYNTEIVIKTEQHWDDVS